MGLPMFDGMKEQVIDSVIYTAYIANYHLHANHMSCICTYIPVCQRQYPQDDQTEKAKGRKDKELH